MKTQYLPGTGASALILIVSLLAATCISKVALAEENERVTESTHYGPGGREHREVIKTTRDTRSAKPAVDKSRTRSASKSAGTSQQSANEDFWFYTADVILFGDEDFDGYYSGIDLLFDADTIYDAADVYAVLYLSFEGGAWEEYAVTDTFTIFGASSADDYSVVSDLVSGYPTGSYDVLIELFDAFNDDFLAYIGPDDTSELSFLPLEDINRDTPPTTVVVIEEEGGGAMGWPMLLTLLLATVAVRVFRSSRASA